MIGKSTHLFECMEVSFLQTSHPLDPFEVHRIPVRRELRWNLRDQPILQLWSLLSQEFDSVLEVEVVWSRENDAFAPHLRCGG